MWLNLWRRKSLTIILRRIDHKILWLENQHDRPDWLNDDDVPADLLSDFSTKNNALSVYEIDEGNSNLQDIIASLAANRDKVQRFDYVLFDKKLLTEKGIQFQNSSGDTPHQEVNEKYHLDIIKLSGKKVAAIGNQFLDYTIESTSKKQIKAIINKYINNDIFSVDNLKKSLLEDL